MSDTSQYSNTMTDTAPATVASSRSRMPLVIGGGIALLVVVGLLVYVFVFNTMERRLIGTWTEKPSAMPTFAGYKPVQMTFNADKTYSASVGLSGTWALDGKLLKFTPKNPTTVLLPPMAWEIESIDANNLKVKLGGTSMEFTR